MKPRIMMGADIKCGTCSLVGEGATVLAYSNLT